MAEVIIVGAGIAGLTLANSLHRFKVPFRIYELRDPSYRVGGSIALAPNALRNLDRLGVYEMLKGRGYPYEEFSMLNGSGAILGTFLNGSVDKWGYPALRIRRQDVKDALIEKLEADGGKVIWNKRFVGVQESDSGVVVSFADGEKVKGGYLVGCDGIHSKARDEVMPSEPEFVRTMSIGAPVDRSLFPTKGMPLPAMMYTPQGFVAFMISDAEAKTADAAFTLSHTIPSGVTSEREYFDALSTDRGRLLALIKEAYETPTTSPLILNVIKDMEDRQTPLVMWAQFILPSLPSWRSKHGRVVIIGDAAHAIPPAGGQGAAMATEDAHSLALVLSSPASGRDQVFAKWEAARAKRLEVIRAFTEFSRQSRVAPANWLARYVREVGMKFFLWWGGSDTGSEMYAYDIDSVRSELFAE